MLFVGLLMISAAVFWASYNTALQRRAGEATEEILTQLYRQIPKTVSLQEPDPMLEPDLSDQPDYLINPEMPMPVCEINGVLYIGYLTIPDLSLDLSVASEWDYPTLELSPCRYSGSAYLDNLVISAHNYGTHFGYIHTLLPGCPVYFTDMDGNVFMYRVALVEILQPNDTQQMIESDFPLTLFTCTTGGRYRVTVRCEKMPLSDFR